VRKAELEQLALAKVEDANLLYEHERYSNAYYLYGYGVELALKAVIANRFRAAEIPSKKLVLGVYTHNLEKLVEWAELRADLEEARKDNEFEANWDIVKRWSEQSRYMTISYVQATMLGAAIEEPHKGVMSWVQSHW